MSLSNELLNPDILIDIDQFNRQQAIRYQKQWVKDLIVEKLPQTINTVAGMDLAFDYALNKAFAVAVVLDANTLEILEVKKAISTISVPYCSGFLSFREVPAIHCAFEQLTIKPDLLVCDGQGIAHPRRFGLACHLGLMYDLPAIGCAKSRLYGYAEEPGKERSSFTELVDNKKQIIGRLLRTRTNVAPVYVSVGHKVTLDCATQWVLKLSPRFRLPETTRHADGIADVFKRTILNYFH